MPNYNPEKWNSTSLQEKLEKAGLIETKSTGYWQVEYDKHPAGVGFMVVDAYDKEDAIITAKKICPTGKNFRNPKTVPEQPTYDELYPAGVNGRNKNEY